MPPSDQPQAAPELVPDVHATILHLFGVHHQCLTFLHNGSNFRLTDISGPVILRIIA